MKAGKELGRRLDLGWFLHYKRTWHSLIIGWDLRYFYIVVAFLDLFFSRMTAVTISKGRDITMIVLDKNYYVGLNNKFSGKITFWGLVG